MTDDAKGQARALRATVLALGAVLVVLGGTKAWLGLARPALDVRRARAWVPAPVSAVQVRIMPFHGVVHTDTEFTYRAADGVERVGERYAFVDPTRFLSESQVLDLQSFATDTCWIDPRDPSRAVLVRELPLAAYRWSGLVVVLLGLAVLALGIASRTSARAARVVYRLPMRWSRLTTLLASSWAAVLALAHGNALTLVLAPALTLLAALVWRRSPEALLVLAVLGGIVAITVLACAANPFVWMDVGIDEANEPWFVVGYVADVALWASLGLATTLLALRARREAAR